MFAPENFKTVAELSNLVRRSIQEQKWEVVVDWLLEEGIFKFYDEGRIDVDKNIRTNAHAKEFYNAVELNVSSLVNYVTIETLRSMGAVELWLQHDSSLHRVSSDPFGRNIIFSGSKLPCTVLKQLSDEEINNCTSHVPKAFKCGTFGKTIHGNFSPFLEIDMLDREVSPNDIPCVNMVTGCIDMSAFKIFLSHLENIEALRSIENASGMRIKIGSRVNGREKLATIRNIYQSLSKYEALPILISEDDYCEAKSTLGLDAPAPNLTDEPHRELLTAYAERPRPRAEMKADLFPNMSERQFDIQWRIAAQQNPEMSKPGRR